MSLLTARDQVLLRDLTGKFDGAYEAAKPFYPNIATRRTSNRYDEKYGWLGSMPVVKEWLSDRQFEQLRAANFTLVNKTWESSLTIEREEFEDDELGQYDMVMQEMGIEAAHHPDKLLFETLVAGEASACWDGQFFFDTDHSWGDSGTQSNDLTHTVASTSALTVTEAKFIYNQAVNAILGFKRDNGEPFIRPTVNTYSDFAIIVPLTHRQIFHEALRAVTVAAGGENVVLDPPQIYASNYLTDNTKIYIVRTGGPIKPFVFQDRKPMVRDWKGMDDIEIREVKFMTEARYVIGYLGWWNATVTTIST